MTPRAFAYLIYIYADRQMQINFKSRSLRTRALEVFIMLD